MTSPGSPAAVARLADAVLARAAGAGRERVLIGIAGPPGSGKTTLAAALVAALRSEAGADAAQALPMDGFHLANETLDRLGRRGRKGAIDTFDGWGFVALLRRLRAAEADTVYAPTFDRRVDEPVAGAIGIAAATRIVIVEGNYLLVRRQPWSLVRGLLDEAWYCETPEDVRLARLVERHVAGGRTRAEARTWARDVDGANARLIEATRGRADRVVSGA